jgi:ADP-ribose pyrophosphatase
MTLRPEHDELIYTGRVVEVHRLGLRMADGQLVHRDLIHYRGAAVALPVLDDGRFVMIRNDRFAVDERLLELPAGMLEAGEDPAACAARELTEETGYAAGRIEPLGMFYTGPGTTDERMFAFLATELTDGPQALEAYEEITVELVGPEAARRMIRDGTLHDGKSIAALGMYWLREGGL